MKLTRRAVIRTGALAIAAPAVSSVGGLPDFPIAAPAAAQDKTWHHGLSLFGEPQYPESFKHFAYVNPNAPKGGSVRRSAFGTFDNFNLVVAGV